ncbi:hypothetical protein BDY19DRAFT_943211 [Irpex rosettiformis]|uniref:Uncharacterized protein n=1 Tax=Irpex rosettiformis TaxID=378272 RepID=A0ACB8U5E0_9APHY|nr:hypothetical protein BDY19DRAFT_943211 [Irpex rosettiformis]
MAPQSTPKPHIIHTPSLKESDFAKITHNVDFSAVRHNIPLGDLTGLTKLGVHLVRLTPHSTSAANHWHTQDDEWIYVVDAGEKGATLVRVITPEVAGEGQTQNEVKKETIYKGDFIAFPASRAVGHHIATGDEEVVFLVCGTRVSVDVCTYPLDGKKLVIDRKMDTEWFVEEGGIEWHKTGSMAGMQK